MNKREPTRTANGYSVFSKIRKFDDRRVYYARIQVNGRRITQKAGYTLESALKLRRRWKYQVSEGTFVHPKRGPRRPKKCPWCGCKSERCRRG